MKKLKSQMLLMEFLMRDMLLPGLGISLLLIITNYILFSVHRSEYWRLFSEQVAGAGFAVAYTAAVVVAMAFFAAIIASRWIGSKSIITLSMLPTGRMWIFFGWVFGGMLMLLFIAAAMNISMSIAAVVSRDKAVLYVSEGIYVYNEPDALWYAYRRVGFLGWVCPGNFGEWTRFILFNLGAPIVTAKTTLGFLADRPFSALLSLGCFILSCVLMALEPGTFNLFSLAVIVCAVFGARRLLIEGDTI